MKDIYGNDSTKDEDKKEKDDVKDQSEFERYVREQIENGSVSTDEANMILGIMSGTNKRIGKGVNKLLSEDLRSSIGLK